MKAFLESIYKDKILLLIIAGIAIPIIFLLVILLFAAIQMDSLAKSMGSLFSPMMYIFSVAIVLSVIYIPFFKKTSHGRTKRTKIVMLLWLFTSIAVLVFSSEKVPLSSSDFSTNTLSWEAAYLALVLFLVGVPFFVLNLIQSKVADSTGKAIIYATFSALLFSLITGVTIYVLKPATLKVAYPYILTHYGNSYSCQGLLNQSIISDNGNISKKAGITAESTTKSVDTIAININNNQLDFVTTAGVQLGDTKGKPLQIVENSDKFLVAIDRDETGLSKPMDVFTLNKKSGIALWSRSLESELFSDDPTSETEYLICR